MARVAQVSKMNRVSRSVSDQGQRTSTEGEDQVDRDEHYQAGRHHRDKSVERTQDSEIADGGAKIGPRPSRPPRISNPLTGTESRNRNLARRVLANLKTSRAKRRWRYVMESEDLTEDYVVK